MYHTLFINTFLPVIQLVQNPQEAMLSTRGIKMDEIVQVSVKGYFKMREDLDEYEKIWHLYVYQPTWNELKAKVLEQLHVVSY